MKLRRSRAASPTEAPRHHKREPEPAVASRTRLWTLDARVRDVAVLTDGDRLRRVLYAAARAGGATVVGEKFCVFGNGAVTGVLVLAQSHLSIHTWPERRLANVDLLSCGDVPGGWVLDQIARAIGAEAANVKVVARESW